MDDDKNKPQVDIARLAPILLGAIIATHSLQSNGISIKDAKIALRLATFLVEELYAKNPKNDTELEQLGQDLSPTMLELIEAELAAEPRI